MKQLFSIAMLILLVAGGVAAQEAPEASNALTLTALGTYQNGGYDEGAAEIVAYHAGTQTVFVVNSEAGTLDLVNISDPAAPALTTQIDISEYGDGANSVAVYGDIVAAAVQADPSQEPGSVVFFTPEGEFVAQVTVGALPDMVTFTPDGTRVLTANEGEPSDDYTVDPEGSVSIIDISGGVENVTDENVTTVSFADFNEDGARADELPEDVRVYGPGATAAMDFEPEYIAVSSDGATAWVTLQENNAIAAIDVAAGTVAGFWALGAKDFSQEANAMDATDEDGGINITTHPAFGLYLPDAIAYFEVDGTGYVISANEGDSRDYEGYSEEGEVSELTLDAEAFPDAETVQALENTGKLEITTTLGDEDGDGDFEALYAPGARSFSIWSAEDGSQVFDSGSALEQITAAAYPEEFNSTNEENGSFEDRSDNAGPEPEGVTVGEVDGVTYAFIGLERIGGIVVYDLSDPTAPTFVTYVNNRDFSGDAEAGTAGDLGPEGITFVSAEDSPTGDALLLVGNEISGTTTIYQISAGM